MRDQALHAYLNDHIAAAFTAREVARRMLRHSEGSALADYLRQFLFELDRDRLAVEGALERLGGRRSMLKTAAGLAGQYLVKLRNQAATVRYTDFARFQDLEFLSVGVAGKHALWAALQVLQKTDRRLEPLDFTPFLEAALGQRARLEEFRLRFVRPAFAPALGPVGLPLRES